jgi:hypothetical protein
LCTQSRRRAHDRRGFGLILVLIILAISGGALAMMAAQSGAMTHQTRRMTEDAWRQDLQASARAWAALHPATDLAPGQVRWVELDASSLGLPGAKVIVGAAAPDANGAPLTVNCQFHSAGRTIRSTASFPFAATTRPSAD